MSDEIIGDVGPGGKELGGDSHRVPTPQEPDQFEVLLRVQDLDTAIAQLYFKRESMPERIDLDKLDKKQLEIDALRNDALEKRSALLKQQQDLEGQIDSLNKRRHDIETKMYASRDSASRDLQAMNDEVLQLSRRRAELEEEELELMTLQEPLDLELGSLESQRSALEEAKQGLKVALSAAESTLNAEIRSLEMARGVHASQLSTALSDHYETLRTRLKGTGAARLVGNRCDGCHLELSAVEVDKIHKLPRDIVVTCDQCGRILIRNAPAERFKGN